MNKLITLEEQITEVKMAKKKYVFLEGQTDLKFWKSVLYEHSEEYNLIDISMVDNSEENNKNAVLKLVKKLNIDKHDSFGIVDLDYDSFIVSGTDVSEIREKNVYYYFGNSLELFLLYSEEFKKVIDLVCTNMDKERINYLRNNVIDISRIKGRIRLINEKKIVGRNISCSNLKVSKCINKKKEAEAETKVIQSLQGSWKLSQDEMSIVVKKLKDYNSIKESLFLCHGHDVFKVLQELIGSDLAPTKNKEKYTEDQLFNYFIPYFEGHAKDKSLPEDLVGTVLIDKIPCIMIPA